MCKPINTHTHTHMARRGSKRARKSSDTVATYPSADLTTAGARRAVWEGRAQKTRGGLTRDDLMVSKSTGKIVSKRASRASKISFERNGLRPDKNIAYKGVRNTVTTRNVEDIDWDELLDTA